MATKVKRELHKKKHKNHWKMGISFLVLSQLSILARGLTLLPVVFAAIFFQLETIYIEIFLPILQIDWWIYNKKKFEPRFLAFHYSWNENVVSDREPVKWST